uniref:Uncharacterized protein n=1 Tax=Oryza nivara TaxID=4536 RepID=A0A0E0GUE6_ORYNI
MYSSLRLVRFPNSGGILPESSFPETARYCIRPHRPYSGGISPEKKLPPRCRWRSSGICTTSMGSGLVEHPEPPEARERRREGAIERVVGEVEVRNWSRPSDAGMGPEKALAPTDSRMSPRSPVSSAGSAPERLSPDTSRPTTAPRELHVTPAHAQCAAAAAVVFVLVPLPPHDASAPVGSDMAAFAASSACSKPTVRDNGTDAEQLIGLQART